MDNPFTIGVLGGMGTYATIHMFKKYAEIFPAEKEWERPRIVIDNNCTMPSRALAWQTGENREKLVSQMTESIRNLIHVGGAGTRVLLACNTSHLFLPEVYERFPLAEKHVLDIIQNCAEQLTSNNLKHVYLLASEGTIDSGIYQRTLEKYGIECKTPEKKEYSLLRACIEAVKQNKYTSEIKNTFLSLLNRDENVILGCTELPVLYDLYEDTAQIAYDPLCMALKKLKEEF